MTKHIRIGGCKRATEKNPRGRRPEAHRKICVRASAASVRRESIASQAPGQRTTRAPVAQHGVRRDRVAGHQSAILRLQAQVRSRLPTRTCIPLTARPHHRTTKNQTFCRNEHNVTGLCSRQSCPLANSRYATVRADPATGVLYLYQKTAERAHLPSRLWERIKLSGDYGKALATIDDRLLHWPPFLVHKCKQRLTRLTQVALRARRLAKEEARLGERVVPRLAPKVRRREETRERRAGAAARVDRAVERELLERLRSGAYGDRPLNVDEGVWMKVLKGLERQGEAVRDRDRDEGIVEEEEEEQEGEEEVEYVSDVDQDEDEEEGDMEELEEWLGSKVRSADQDSEASDESDEDAADNDGNDDSAASGSDDSTASPRDGLAPGKRKRRDPSPKARKRKGPRMEIEYEHEVPLGQREALHA